MFAHARSLPRYIRWREPVESDAVVLAQLRSVFSPSALQGERSGNVAMVPSADLALVPRGPSEVEADVDRVRWLPGSVFSIPRCVRIAQSPLFRDAVVAAGDAASFLAVAVLQPRKNDFVLDLCCSPGVKLCLISDALRAGGNVVGVDVNLDRLYVARAASRKYGCNVNTSLVLADGRLFRPEHLLQAEATRFALQRRNELHRRADRKRARENDGEGDGEDSHPSSSANAAIMGPMLLTKSEALARLLAEESSSFPRPFRVFDRALVDAECTHDGSLAHICVDTGEGLECSAVGPGGITNTHRMRHMNLDTDGDTLFHLQLGLLRNAASLVSFGGSLVYSTCSFSVRQNEDVIRAFLASSEEWVSVDPLGDKSGLVVAGDPLELEVDPCLRWGPGQLDAARAVTDLNDWGRRVDIKRAQTSFQFISKLMHSRKTIERGLQ